MNRGTNLSKQRKIGEQTNSLKEIESIQIHRYREIEKLTQRKKKERKKITFVRVLRGKPQNLKEISTSVKKDSDF